LIHADKAKSEIKFSLQIAKKNAYEILRWPTSGGESWQLLIAIQHSFCTVMYVLLSMWFCK